MTQPPFITSRNDLSILNSYELDQKKRSLLIKRVKRYAEMHCAGLAGRLHERTGWPIVALIDPLGTQLFHPHYCVRNPHGSLVDAYGVCPRRLDSMVTSRYGIDGGTWRVLPNGGGLPGLLSRSMRRTVDDFLDSPWMIAVVPLANRL